MCRGCYEQLTESAHNRHELCASEQDSEQWNHWKAVPSAFDYAPTPGPRPTHPAPFVAFEPQVKYDRAAPLSFTKAFSYESRPGPPWSYPQTGMSVWISLVQAGPALWLITCPMT